jgi:hypothetical protein
MYIVKLLTDLTHIGFLKWVRCGKNEFETAIGDFSLKIFEEKRVAQKRGLFKTKEVNTEHWILRIQNSNGTSEEIAGWDDSDFPATFGLFLAAKYSSDRKPSSPVQSDLYKTILQTLGLKP